MPTTQMQPGEQHIGPAPEVLHPETQEDLASAGMGSVSYLPAPLRPAGSLGTKDEIQLELDLIATAVRGFSVKPPDAVLREISAYSARLTEMIVLLHRVEATDRQYTRVRTMQVEKWLKDLDLQFRVASRLIEVQRQDIDLSR